MVRDASTRYEHLCVALRVKDGGVVGNVASCLPDGSRVSIRADDVESVDFNIGAHIVSSPVYGDLVDVGPRIAIRGFGGGRISTAVGETGVARIPPSGEGETT